MGGSNAWRLGMKSLLTPGTRTLRASAVGLDSLTPLWLVISPLPLNTFHQDPLVRSELICTLTGNIVNKSEEHVHGKRFLNIFEVLDEEPGDDEEGGGQRMYKLPWSHIIPFPKWNDPSGAQDFPTGKQVLAVYPSATALYKATVVQPRKRKADDYVLEFDDDEEKDGSLPQRIVPFHRVVGIPEGHRQ